MTTPSDQAVEFARQTIEATLDVPVETWDRHGRQGAHDLRLELEGRSVAVEVKFDVDPRYQELERIASRTGYVLDDRLQRLWRAHLAHAKRYDDALRALPELLLAAEQTEWSGGSVRLLRRSDPDLTARLEALGITFLSGLAPTEKHPPGFYLLPDGWGGFVPTADALTEYVSELLAGPSMKKLRRQLADAKTDQRHAFLVVGIEHMISAPLETAYTRPAASADGRRRVAQWRDRQVAHRRLAPGSGMDHGHAHRCRLNRLGWLDASQVRRSDAGSRPAQ